MAAAATSLVMADEMLTDLRDRLATAEQTIADMRERLDATGAARDRLLTLHNEHTDCEAKLRARAILAESRVASLEASNESLRIGAEMLLRDLAAEGARGLALADMNARQAEELVRLRASVARVVDDPYAAERASTVPPDAGVSP